MEQWQDIPLIFGYDKNSRGIGLADMAMALRTGRPHRANVDLTWHVLDIMHGFHDSSREGRVCQLESTCEKPAPMPMG